MREIVLAIRAIWDVLEHGTPLAVPRRVLPAHADDADVRPGPNPYGDPKILLAGVGELMTEVAGEVADGMILPRFTTERYLREVTLPALERGFAKAAARAPTSRSAARCSSSPARPRRRWRRPRGDQAADRVLRLDAGVPGVLELHGWGDLQHDLNRLSKQGEWVQMGELVDDEILGTFAVVAEPEQVATAMKARYGDRRRSHPLHRADAGRPRPLGRRPRPVPRLTPRRFVQRGSPTSSEHGDAVAGQDARPRQTA
jgi:hypothetical protein